MYVVGSRRLMPSDALQPKAYCTNPGKYATWDKRLYLPSKGKRAEDFFTLKNPTASAEFAPANLGTKGQHATSRPPKPFRIHTYVRTYIHAYKGIRTKQSKHNSPFHLYLVRQNYYYYYYYYSISIILFNVFQDTII